MIIHGMDSPPSALLRLLFLVVVALSADPDLMGNVVEEAISAERGKFHIKELTATDARRILEGLKEKDLAIVADLMEEKMETNSSSEKSQESFQTTEKMEILETTTAEITTKPSRPHHLFPNAVAPMVLNNRGGPIKEMLDMILSQKNLLTTQRTTVTTTLPPTTTSSAPSSSSSTLPPILIETTKVTERPKEQAKVVTTVVVVGRGAGRRDDVLPTLSPLLRESDKVTVPNRKLLRNPPQKRNRQLALRHEATTITTSTSTTTTEAPPTTTTVAEKKEDEKEKSREVKTEPLKTDAVKVPKGEQTRKTTPSPTVRRQPPLKTLPLRQIPRKPQKSSRGPARNNSSRSQHPHPHHQQQQRRPAVQRQAEEPPLSLLIIRNGRLLQLTSSQQRDLDVVLRSLVPLSDAPPLRRFQRKSL